MEKNKVNKFQDKEWKPTMFSYKELTPMENYILVSIPKIPERKGLIHLPEDTAVNMFKDSTVYTVLKVGSGFNGGNLQEIKEGDKILPISGTEVPTFGCIDFEDGTRAGFMQRYEIQAIYRPE